MENDKNQTHENQNENTKPMEKDDIVNPEQFQVGRTTEKGTGEQDDSQYAPEENQFADGKGSNLADKLDVPDPEDVDEEEADVLDEDLEIDDDKDLNQDLN